MESLELDKRGQECGALNKGYKYMYYIKEKQALNRVTINKYPSFP